MKKFQRDSYTQHVSLDVGESFIFPEDIAVDCLIEKYTNLVGEETNIWRADVFYSVGIEPTVLTYELTGIEISDLPNVFCIFNNTNRLVIKNNETNPVTFKLTRRA
jgi:hypothetical protein